MGDVIPFPGTGKAGISKALDYIRSSYVKAGLEPEQLEAALEEVEPLIHSFFAKVKKEFEFNLTGNFTQEQVETIVSAHNAAANDMMRYYTEQLWLALCHTAGYIGRVVKNG